MSFSVDRGTKLSVTPTELGTRGLRSVAGANPLQNI